MKIKSPAVRAAVRNRSAPNDRVLFVDIPTFYREHMVGSFFCGLSVFSFILFLYVRYYNAESFVSVWWLAACPLPLAVGWFAQAKSNYKQRFLVLTSSSLVFTREASKLDDEEVGVLGSEPTATVADSLQQVVSSTSSSSSSSSSAATVMAPSSSSSLSTGGSGAPILSSGSMGAAVAQQVAAAPSSGELDGSEFAGLVIETVDYRHIREVRVRPPTDCAARVFSLFAPCCAIRVLELQTIRSNQVIRLPFLSRPDVACDAIRRNTILAVPLVTPVRTPSRSDASKAIP